MPQHEVTDLSRLRRKNMRTFFHEMGESKEDVARKTGLSSASIHHLFGNGELRVNIGTRVAGAIIDAYGLDIDFFDTMRFETPLVSREEIEGDQEVGTLSMNANGIIFKSRKITEEQADEIARIVLRC